MSFDPEHFGLNEKELLFAANTFKKISSSYGKSSPDLREAIRKSANIFIHYLVDGCIEMHHSDKDDERKVDIRSSDVIKVLEDCGLGHIAKSIR